MPGKDAPDITNDEDLSRDESSDSGARDADLTSASDPNEHLKSARNAVGQLSKRKDVLTPKQSQLIQEFATNPSRCYRRAEDSLAKWQRRKTELETANEQFRKRLSP